MGAVSPHFFVWLLYMHMSGQATPIAGFKTEALCVQNRDGMTNFVGPHDAFLVVRVFLRATVQSGWNAASRGLAGLLVVNANVRTAPWPTLLR
jgi:hypothetical protein